MSANLLNLNILKWPLAIALVLVSINSFANDSADDIEALVVKGFEAIDLRDFDLADQFAQKAQASLERGATGNDLLVEKVLAIHQTTPQKKNWSELRILQLMGTVRYQQGRFQQAEPYYRKILKLSNGQYSDIGMWACDNLASLLGLTNRLPEAIDTITSCLPIGYAGSFSLPEKQVALSYVELLRAAGKAVEAEKYARSILLDLQQQSNPDHWALAKLMTNLARVVSSKEAGSRWVDAEGLLKEALSHYKKVATEDDLDYLDTAQDLGVVLSYRDKLDEAEVLLDKVVKARVRLMGKEHLNTAIASEKLALVLFVKRRYEDAEPLLENSFNTYKKIYGRNALSDNGIGRGVYELLIQTLKILNKDKEVRRLQRDNGLWIVK